MVFSSISILSDERPRDDPFKSNLRWILNSVQNIFPITTKRNCTTNFYKHLLASCRKETHIIIFVLRWNMKTIIESNLWCSKWSAYIKIWDCKYSGKSSYIKKHILKNNTHRKMLQSQYEWYLLTTWRFNPVKTKEFSDECVFIRLHMMMIVRKHS